jgi:hypothetical protein
LAPLREEKKKKKYISQSREGAKASGSHSEQLQFLCGSAPAFRRQADRLPQFCGAGCHGIRIPDFFRLKVSSSKSSCQLRIKVRQALRNLKVEPSN